MEDKLAYWIPVDCNFAGDSGLYCSNCGFFVSDYTDGTEEYYHCPKCGFIMGEPIKEQINKTTEQRAIDLLNAFTKTWCMDYEATQKSDEPIFRCKVCSFKAENSNVCAVKDFAYTINDEYTRYVDFGCMGLL